MKILKILEKEDTNYLIDIHSRLKSALLHIPDGTPRKSDLREGFKMLTKLLKSWDISIPK